MSVQEIKEQLVALPQEKQNEVVAYLFHHRHRNDAAYQDEVARRLNDKESGNWLSPDEFERELDAGEN